MKSKKTTGGAGSTSPASAGSPDYAYKTIEEFEEIVGYKVNEVFRDGWRMARTTNAHLGILAKKQYTIKRNGQTITISGPGMQIGAEYALTHGREAAEIRAWRRTLDKHLANGGTLGNFQW